MVITKNQATNEILSVQIEESTSARDGMEKALTDNCESNSLYQLQVKELDL